MSICWLSLGIAGSRYLSAVCVNLLVISRYSWSRYLFAVCINLLAISRYSWSRYLFAVCIDLLAISRYSWVSLFVCSLYQSVGYLKVQLDLVICLQSVSICWLSLGTAGSRYLSAVCINLLAISRYIWSRYLFAVCINLLAISRYSWSRYLFAVLINLLAISRYSWISLFVCSLYQSVGYI